MLRVFLSPLLLLLVLIGAPTVFAQGAGATTYHVEVVVFRNSGAREGEPSASPARFASGDAVSGATQMARYLGPLPATKLQLSGARQKLTASGYRVLAHTGWTQTASTWNTRSGLPVEQLGLQIPGLSGNFLLERGSLLHFGMNLRYAPEGGIAQQMNELRRIRFNEKNYYDHPGLGVIVVVTPGRR
ncbi:MAG: hypothetical protein FJ196_03150 [Gammaproteobacteria bacterium]|nr:hypothetical protein [Gammaproteobacteria bacterium]